MSGSKKTQLTPLQKILMGGGKLRNIHKPNGGRKVRDNANVKG